MKIHIVVNDSKEDSNEKDDNIKEEINKKSDKVLEDNTIANKNFAKTGENEALKILFVSSIALLIVKLIKK